ncbi:MAG: branched-chain amino acid ABC transporter permease [Hyphomicrobiales bacterium]|nr:MAG: branched-chain amino acid ABC transporter permease [Hyphomicrobiales bacterium]
MVLFIEQLLNGVQLGIFLFLVSAGLTLIFGIMGIINLAHGSLFMVGAFVAATATTASGSFVVGLIAGVAAAGVTGLAMEYFILRHLYHRDHLDQVLATFGIILFANEMVTIIWGRTPLFFNAPDILNGSIELVPGIIYPVYRLFIIAVGIAVAALLYGVITRTRVGMLVRAGATDREMVGALGVNISVLFMALFGFGAMLAGLAGAMAGPLISVEAGMGESQLILSFVVVVIGGMGSLRGAFIGAMLVGIVDTMGRAFIPDLLKLFLPIAEADGLGAGLSSMSIYMLMALVLVIKPSGLFPASSGSH